MVALGNFDIGSNSQGTASPSRATYQGNGKINQNNIWVKLWYVWFIPW